jgi:hypothetical protein
MARRWTVIALLLALVQGALLAATAWDKADTFDEPHYLGMSAMLWTHRDISMNRGSPILPKWVFGASMRLAGAGIERIPPTRKEAVAAIAWARSGSDFRRLLFRVRLTTIAAMVVAGLLLWRTALRFGPGVGLTTHALWCFSPTVLSDGSLATLDPWTAALSAVVLWTIVRFLEEPRVAWSALVGLALAGAVACKVTTVGLVPLAMAAIAWGAVRAPAPRSRTPRRAGVQLTVCGGAMLVGLWALYGFTVGPAPVRFARSLGPVPFPAWVEGLYSQADRGFDRGHANYLFGETSNSGWWWFYLACIALKTTVGAQALALLRGVALVWRRPSATSLWADVALLSYPVLLFVVMSASKHQGGISFLLPAFPFVMLWVGRVWVDAQRAFGRVGLGLCLLLLASGAAEALAHHPHHLMFVNAWVGGPVNAPRYLVHRLDWGQDKRRLGEWLHAHDVKRVYYARYGGHPSQWGIAAEPVPCEPTVGVYALHAILVHRPLPGYLEAGCVDWLTVAAPDERIGYSIYVYRVDADRLVRLREARSRSTPFWRSGPPVAHGDSLPPGRQTTMSRLDLSIQPADPGRALAGAD